MSTASSVFEVFGTQGELAVVDGRRLGDARRAADAVLAEVDRACSRFRDDSDLERANRSVGHPVAVDRCLLDAVEVALHAARRTDGAVDPTVGRAVVQLGYDRDFRELTDDGAPLVFARVPGWRRVVVDHRAGTVTVPAGTRIDLGATAKAWAADRAAAAAADAAGCGVLLGLGGDIAMVGEPPSGGWSVQVSDWCGDPVDDGFESVLVHSGGIATSGTTVRRWVRRGRELHHIVDPSTGDSAEVVWRTVTVAAGSCLDANVAATAAVVKGETAPAWLEAIGLPARLVRPDDRVVRVGCWPEERAA